MRIEMHFPNLTSKSRKHLFTNGLNAICHLIEVEFAIIETLLNRNKMQIALL